MDLPHLAEAVLAVIGAGTVLVGMGFAIIEGIEWALATLGTD